MAFFFKNKNTSVQQFLPTKHNSGETGQQFSAYMKLEGILPYHKDQSLVPLTRHINQIRTIRNCFFEILFSILIPFSLVPQRLWLKCT